ncbi:hypothetical protein [Defluviimonas salinarum]|uniref:Uncharacterized protein n=1 Tax=Defluviimonas salinarum TaxID=2992147 RepID=A0ABT3J5U5_9RHOB|nr:hypothetical protein [Defluviimonas salinarum]MCW3783027.1 hypothetical protein [Defluviimonas salinarum]
MGQSLVLRHGAMCKTGQCQMALRTHDLSGADYQPIVRMTIEQGLSVAAGVPSVRWLFRPPLSNTEIRPMRLEAVLRTDPGAEKVNWILEGVSDTGRERICHIGDRAVRELESHGALANTPDWATADRIEKRLLIEALRAEADQLEAELTAAEHAETPQP